MSRLSNLCNSRGSMPRKKYSPFSRIEGLQLLQPDKRWDVLSSNVCGERAPKYFSRNRLPARFPDDVMRIKRCLGKYLMVPVRREGFFRRRNRGFVVWFDCDILSPFTRFAIISRGKLDLDLSVLSQEQADGARTHVDVSLTPVVNATANRWLEMPLS